MSPISFRTPSAVSASTSLSIRRKPLVDPKNLFASTASTVNPLIPACFRASAKSNSDVLITVPLPRTMSKVLSIPLRTSPACCASAATFTRPATCLNPGATGTARVKAPSTKPDIRLYAREPSVVTVPAKPRPIVQA